MNKEPESSHGIQAGQPAASPVMEKRGDPDVVFLPPPQAAVPAAAPQAPPRWFVGVDRLQALMLLGLAFLLGSFAATNADLWLQLASGRLIAEGKWTYGVDPFTFGTEAVGGEAAVPWYNQNWLFSLVLYKLYTWVGGAGLVVIKALVVVLLIFCLKRIRPAGSSRQAVLWLTLLVALAITPQIVLSPVTLSLFFFALTLLLLFKAGALSESPDRKTEGNQKLLWRLPLLFIVWANLDSWVILGPLTILLLWLGSGLSLLFGQKNAVPGRTLGILFGVSLLACLVNPHHVHIFQLPSDLAFVLVKYTSPLGITLPDFLVAGGKTMWQIHGYDPDLMLLLSPFSGRYIVAVNGGFSVAGGAAAILLLVSLVSFLMLGAAGGSVFPTKRFIIWVVFALLAASLYKLVAVFAVATGPLAVLNFAEFAAWLRGAKEPIRVRGWTGGILARLAMIPVLLLLFFLAWPGWIFTYPGDFTAPRRVTWAVVENPSLRDAALRLGELQRAGKLERVLNFQPAIADYCAWFAPNVRCCLDERYPLFARVADQYASARDAMQKWVVEPERIQAIGATEWRDAMNELENARKEARASPDPKAFAAAVASAHKKASDVQDSIVKEREAARKAWLEKRKNWEGKLRDLGIDHVVLNVTYRPGRASAPQKLVQLWWNPAEEWVQRYADGRSFAFYWNRERKPRSECDDWWSDYDRKAFGPNVPDSERPPLDGTPLPVGEVPFWTRYLEGYQNQPSLDHAKAQLASMRFEYLALLQQWRHPAIVSTEYTCWTNVAGFCGVAPGSTLGPSALLSFMYIPSKVYDFVLPNNRPFLDAGDMGPPALPILELRHVRRAIAEMPSDYRNYAMLHSAVHTLLDQQEDFWARRGRNAKNLRGVLRKIQATTALKTYLDMQPTDPELHKQLADVYMQEYFLDLALEHYREALKHFGNSPLENQEARGKELKKLVERVERDVLMRRGEFDLQKGDKKPLEKFFTAVLTPFKMFDQNNKEVVDKDGMGLVLVAMQELKDIRPETLARDEIVEVTRAQIHLLLMMGRAVEVEEILSDKKVAVVLGSDFFKYRLWLAAAKGDYDLMDKSLIELENKLGMDRIDEWKDRIQEWNAQILGLRMHLVGMSNLPLLGRIYQCNPNFFTLDNLLRERAFNKLHDAAEYRLLRGILALESGDTAKALQHIEDALKFNSSGFTWQDRPIAVKYARLLREQKARAAEKAR